jgi:hypothetical protein
MSYKYAWIYPGGKVVSYVDHVLTDKKTFKFDWLIFWRSSRYWQLTDCWRFHDGSVTQAVLKNLMQILNGAESIPVDVGCKA